MQKFLLILFFILQTSWCLSAEILTQPRRGDLLLLSEGVFELHDVRAEEVFHQVFDHLHEGMTEFVPDMGEDGAVRYFNVNVNEKKNPYFVLQATLWIRVPIIKYVKVNRRVEAEVTKAQSVCKNGQRIMMDLDGSDRDIYLQAEYVYVDFCILEKKDSNIKVQYTAHMVVGADFGLRMAGQLVKDVLTLQIKPLIKVFTDQFNKLRAVKSRKPASLNKEDHCEDLKFFAKRECINKKGERRAQLFFKGLSESDQQNLLEIVSRGYSRKNSLITLKAPAENNRPVLFFIQGLFYKEGYEWYRPFHWLDKSESGAYLYRFPKLASTKKMAQEIQVYIKGLMQVYPNRKIEVVAFSAGGIPALMAWEKLQESLSDEEFHNIHLTTAATPIAGYDVPWFINKLSAIFPFTSLSHDLMAGLKGRFEKRNLSQCSHIVTTDCELDIHACNNNPQLLAHMPCGHENTYLSDRFTHHQALESVVGDFLF